MVAEAEMGDSSVEGQLVEVVEVGKVIDDTEPWTLTPSLLHSLPRSLIPVSL